MLNEYYELNTLRLSIMYQYEELANKFEQQTEELEDLIAPLNKELNTLDSKPGELTAEEWARYDELDKQLQPMWQKLNDLRDIAADCRAKAC